MLKVFRFLFESVFTRYFHITKKIDRLDPMGWMVRIGAYEEAKRRYISNY
jgi:hypothetical protein